MQVISNCFIIDAKVQVNLLRKDFGLAATTYNAGIIRQVGETNVYNPVTKTLEKTAVVNDLPLKVTTTDVCLYKIILQMVPFTNVSQTQIDASTKKVIPWLDNRTAPKEFHGIDPNAIPQKK